MLGQAAVLTAIALTYLGAFSRLTGGQYTPAFYAYQLDRAPNDASTWFLPYLDATLGTLLVYTRTRPVAAFLCVVFQGLGIASRIQAGKSAAPDVALCLVAFVALLRSVGFLF